MPHISFPLKTEYDNLDTVNHTWQKNMAGNSGHSQGLKTYSPSDLNTNPELEPEWFSYFQSLIGITWWIAALGQVKITTEFCYLCHI